MDLDGMGKEISRRKMLKRIGAGAAIAWTAPVLTSLRTPAFGQRYAVCAECPGCGQAGFPAPCGAEPSCFCVGTAEGGCFCSNDFGCGATGPCTTSADCPTGWACQSGPGAGCCGSGVCVPPCGTSAGTNEGGKTNAG
jgi:hypothetical protein